MHEIQDCESRCEAKQSVIAFDYYIMRLYKQYIFRFICIVGSIICLAGLCACSAGKKADGSASVKTYRMTDFVMSTVLSVTVYGTEDVTGRIKDLLKKLEEDQLSWRIEESTVAKVNASGRAGAGQKTNAAFLSWMEESLLLARKSKGAFDPSIGALIRLWDIEGENPKVPAEKELADAMKKSGYPKIHADAATTEITLDQGCTVDLGAVGKGIACDVIKDYLDAQGTDIQGAVVAVGGSVLVYGKKAEKDSWSVAIQDPRGQDGEYMGALSLTGTKVVSTSGDYEKYFVEDGKRYHHILDPRTGYPAEKGLISVTVVCENGLVSDGLSTACFVLGKDEGMALLKDYEAEGIFIDRDKNVWITDGIKKQFKILDPDYKEREG